MAEQADWSSPADVRESSATASFVGERVVFNIGGNKYRVIVFITCEVRTVFVRWIGTHRDYDKVDAEGV